MLVEWFIAPVPKQMMESLLVLANPLGALCPEGGQAYQTQKQQLRGHFQFCVLGSQELRHTSTQIRLVA